MLPHNNSYAQSKKLNYKRIIQVLTVAFVASIVLLVYQKRSHESSRAELKRSLLRQIQELRQNENLLRDSLDKSNSRLTALQQDLTHTSSDRDDLRSQLEERESELRQQTEKFTASIDSLNYDLKQCNNKTKSYAENCSEDLKRQYDRVSDLSKQVDRCHQELEEVQTKYKEALKIIMENRKKSEKSENDQRVLELEKEKLQSMLNNAQSQLPSNQKVNGSQVNAGDQQRNQQPMDNQRPVVNSDPFQRALDEVRSQMKKQNAQSDVENADRSESALMANNHQQNPALPELVAPPQEPRDTAVEAPDALVNVK